jgi:hypothetical protein
MVQLQKKISGRDPEGAWRQNKFIGDKPPVTLTLVLGPTWDLTPRPSGRLNVGRNVTLTLLVSYSWEPRIVSQSSASKDVSTKLTESPVLEAVTKQGIVKS